MAYAWMWWIGLAVIFLLVEAATVNLVTIWLGISAIVVAVLSAFVPFILVQVILFLILTIVLIYFTRPIAMKYLKPKATNAPGLKGKEAIVTMEINDLKNTGEVRLSGNFWTARTNTNHIIKVGQRVIVKDIKGVTLIVERKEEV